MLEISPRLTYSPDGILQLRHAIDYDDGDSQSTYDQNKEELAAKPGYEVVVNGDETLVSVQLDKVVQSSRENDFINPSAVRLIQNLRNFTYFDYREPRDGVFSIDFWSDKGASGVVFPQFQRWLNAQGFDEESARRAIDAMAYPFGAEMRKRARKEFRYRTDGEYAAAGDGGFIFGVVSRREDFGIAMYEESEDEPSEKQGRVAWSWIELSTIGDCACWGPSGEARENVYIKPGRSRLYEMWPHNVDSAVQSLSLVLGIGALAYKAAQYSGQEDILENTVWE